MPIAHVRSISNKLYLSNSIFDVWGIRSSFVKWLQHENLFKILVHESESFRPHLKNLMKYENLEGLQNVEKQVDFLDFMTHFHDENLILLSSLEFVRTAQLVFTKLADWFGECSVLLAGNRWYSATVKGLSPQGQIEVFCKNDTKARFVNFNQLRLVTLKNNFIVNFSVST